MLGTSNGKRIIGCGVGGSDSVEELGDRSPWLAAESRSVRRLTGTGSVPRLGEEKGLTKGQTRPVEPDQEQGQTNEDQSDWPTGHGGEDQPGSDDPHYRRQQYHQVTT